MGANTSIEWCDHTFNPWWGCQKVSPACDHCYAERDAKRFASGRVLWGVDSERRTFEDKHWEAPKRWARAPFFQCQACGARGGDKAEGYRRVCKVCGSADIKPARMRVFCASMADWLDLDAPISEFVRLLDTIRLTPELDWLLLTKRIGNWRKRVAEALSYCAWSSDSAAFSAWLEDWLEGAPPAHVWVGATIVNREEMLRDGPKLKATPARVHFWSVEPMLGDLGEIPLDLMPDWGICGGESGAHARPMHPAWVRSYRDQFALSGRPWLFKQWGDWAPVRRTTGLDASIKMPGQNRDVWAWPDGTRDGWRFGPVSMRIGKKAAGRVLDGRTHDEFPRSAV